MADKSAEDEKFLSELRHNEFLEREAAYHKANVEIEKRTTELIARMEQYSKSRSCIGSYYDGGDTASEFGTEDGMSICSERPFTSKPPLPDVNEERGGGDGDLGDSLKRISTTTTAEKLSRLYKDINSNIADHILVDVGLNPRLKKQKSRLQKATESVIKSLQAKLLNHEERLTDLHLQYRQKIQENTIQESKIKALEEERERLLKLASNQQGVIDKHAKSAESSKSNLTLKSHTVSVMKKEIDDLKREKKQTSTTCTTYQSRLQRVSEENEKLRSLNKSLTLQLREIRSDHKLRLDEKQQKILELEKCRNMLNTTITRQASLIKQQQQQSSNVNAADKQN